MPERLFKLQSNPAGNLFASRRRDRVGLEEQIGRYLKTFAQPPGRRLADRPLSAQDFRSRALQAENIDDVLLLQVIFGHREFQCCKRGSGIKRREGYTVGVSLATRFLTPGKSPASNRRPKQSHSYS